MYICCCILLERRIHSLPQEANCHPAYNVLLARHQVRQGTIQYNSLPHLYRCQPLVLHDTAEVTAFFLPMQTMFPSPFYFFDEIDCALDTSAAARVAAYVSQHSKTAQYLLVSHRPQVFEAASCLVGVYTSPTGCGSAAVLAHFDEGEKQGDSIRGEVGTQREQAVC